MKKISKNDMNFVFGGVRCISTGGEDGRVWGRGSLPTLTFTVSGG